MDTQKRLDAGRELDALVAKKIMGWKWVDPHKVGFWTSWDSPPAARTGLGVLDEAWGEEEIPHYSTDIAAAWDVVEKLKSTSRRKRCGPIGFSLLWDDQDKVWDAGFCQMGFYYDGSMDYSAEEPSAPYAICLAALKAVGVSS